MAGGAALAVSGYVKLAQWLLDNWAGQATKAATGLDAGTVTADEVAANVSGSAALALQSLALVTSEALDAAAVLGGSQYQPYTVTSQDFSAASASYKSGTNLTLELAGPLLADVGTDSLPVSVVTIVPSVLTNGATMFHLEADATGHMAVGYSGEVTVLNDQGKPLASIDVWLTG